MRLPNLPKIEITPTLFYKFGIWCFLIMALGNTYSLAQWWGGLDWGIRCMKLASIAFNLLLVLFFKYLKGSTQPQEAPVISDEDLSKAFEKLA